MSEDSIRSGLNWHTYANNNPLLWFDPSGLEAEKLREFVNSFSEAIYTSLTWKAEAKTATVIFADKGYPYIIKGGTAPVTEYFTVGVDGTYIDKNGDMYVDSSQLHSLWAFIDPPLIDKSSDIYIAAIVIATGIKVAPAIYASVVNQGADSVNINKVLETVQQVHKGDKSLAGHALQKHAGRNPNIWGSVKGGAEQINQQAMKHIDDIINGSGEFKIFTTDRGVQFWEKRLPDGRGLRLNLDGTFKGFIDQIKEEGENGIFRNTTSWCQETIY